MQTTHIKARGQNRWPRGRAMLRISSILSLIVLVVLVRGSEAIVKQQQQRSDDLQLLNGPQQQQQQQQSQQQQQQSPQQQQSHQSAFNNHQSPSVSGAAGPSSSGQSSQQQPSYSSSVSISSSSSSPSAAGSAVAPSSQGPAGSSSGSQAQIATSSQAAQSGRSDQMNVGPSGAYSNSYAPNGVSNMGQSAGGSNQKLANSYLDNMSAAASSPEQSYQAAANNVNMALINSGIFGPSALGYNPSSSSGSGNQQAQSQQNGPSNSPQQLNPLHYFYYPAKDTASPQAKAAQQADMMSNAASTNYQSYPSYADHLGSALSGIGAGPEAAASSQDPSYLPQPGISNGANNDGMQVNGNGGPQMYNGQQQQGNQQQQQQQQQQSQQQQGAPHQGYNGDLGSFSSSISASNSAQQQQPNQQQPGQQSGSISFSGPSSNGGQLGNGPSGDYLGSHLGNSGHQQAMPAYPNSPFSQLGDLSTSNFGNNPGGLSSVASYMSPNQQHPSSSPQQTHDMFSNSANNLQIGNSGQLINSASQLSASAVSPLSGGSQSSNGNVNVNGNSNGLGSSSFFGQASQLFGPQANSPTGSGLFANQHYLNSFLNPQYSGMFGSGQQSSADQTVSASSQNPSVSGSGSSVAPQSGSSSSSKRYGLSSFVVPVLALAGLSLLIPTISNIGTAVGRKKRSIEDRASNSRQQIFFEPMNGDSQTAKEMSIGEYIDKIERYYSIYEKAVESDDCLNRLICEFGDAVKDINGKSAVVTVIEKLVPNWMTGKVHLFKEAALESKEGKEKCKKYVCQSNRYH